MRTVLLACALGFVVTAAIGPSIIHWLRKMKFGQHILEDGPTWHMKKENIPTMGGFMFIIGIGVAVLVMGALSGVFFGGTTAGEVAHYFALPGLALLYGLVGFVDDYAKIKHRANAGLTPMQKLVLQIVVAAVFISMLRLFGSARPEVYLPFIDITLTLPWPVFVLFACFVIVGCDNAVNLTDGIDGLAAGVTLPVAVFFALAALRQQNLAAAIFAGALAGGLLGFLIYNFNPAKVFMGDTGSLFLGGAVAGLAFACNMPVILVLVGFIYVLETVSVVLQIGYFKLTHGKRLFKMAPIHHHFEMCGWNEKQIVLTAAGLTVLLCAAAWCGLY